MIGSISGGKLVFHIFAGLAEFEREIIKRRKLGGPPKALTEKQVQMLKTLAANPEMSIDHICKTLGIGRATYYRYITHGE